MSAELVSKIKRVEAATREILRHEFPDHAVRESTPKQDKEDHIDFFMENTKDGTVKSIDMKWIGTAYLYFEYKTRSDKPASLFGKEDVILFAMSHGDEWYWFDRAKAAEQIESMLDDERRKRVTQGEFLEMYPEGSREYRLYVADSGKTLVRFKLEDMEGTYYKTPNLFRKYPYIYSKAFYED